MDTSTYDVAEVARELNRLQAYFVFTYRRHGPAASALGGHGWRPTQNSTIDPELPSKPERRAYGRGHLATQELASGYINIYIHIDIVTYIYMYIYIYNNTLCLGSQYYLPKVIGSATFHPTNATLRNHFSTFFRFFFIRLQKQLKTYFPYLYFSPRREL